MCYRIPKLFWQCRRSLRCRTCCRLSGGCDTVRLWWSECCENMMLRWGDTVLCVTKRFCGDSMFWSNDVVKKCCSGELMKWCCNHTLLRGWRDVEKWILLRSDVAMTCLLCECCGWKDIVNGGYRIYALDKLNFVRRQMLGWRDLELPELAGIWHFKLLNMQDQSFVCWNLVRTQALFNHSCKTLLEDTFVARFCKRGLSGLVELFPKARSQDNITESCSTLLELFLKTNLVTSFDNL